MTNEKIDINDFLISIDNMIKSKYILVDRRIADVLLAIAGSTDVYNLIAECMINFDFKYEWKRATGGMYLKLPEGDAKKISFIFCMLNNIDDGNIDITKLLDRFFSYDAELSPYELFCKTIIAQFKQLILEHLNYDNVVEEVSNEVIDQPNEYKNDFEILTEMIRELLTAVKAEKKLKKCFMQKNDLVAVLATFEQVAYNRLVEYFYAFIVTIKSALIKEKKFTQKVLKICDLANDLISRS